MARVYRQQYTRPIPPGAQRIKTKARRRGQLIEVEAVRFKGDDGRWTVAPVVQKGKNAGRACRVHSPTWYGKVGGQPVALCTNKAASEVMLADLVRQAEKSAAGLIDPHAKHRKRPLTQHLEDYLATLRAEGVTAKQVELKGGRIRRVLAGCRAVYPGDLSASVVQQYLGTLQEPTPLPAMPDGEVFDREQAAAALGIKPDSVAYLVRHRKLEVAGKGKGRRFPRSSVEALREQLSRGAGPQTINHYIAALVAFGNWLVDDGRLPSNPLGKLARLNVEVDLRCQRRPLSGEDLRKVIATADQSKKVVRGLDGHDRALLYAVAAASGFRAQELGRLAPASFDLGEVPTVALPARRAKNRRATLQPLPADLARALQPYLADLPADQPVWPGTWWTRAAAMLRIDLEAAGIPFVVDGPDGELRADFHAIRHSFVALCDAAGLTLKESMQLARHSDPRLTMNRYGRLQAHDLQDAVNRLPYLLPATVTAPAALTPDATEGTDREGGPVAYTTLTQAGDSGSVLLSFQDNKGASDAAPEQQHNPLPDSGFEGPRGPKTLAEADCQEEPKDQSDGRHDRRCLPCSAWKTPYLPTPYTALTQHLQSSPELVALVEAWPDLPAHIKAAILALVQTALPALPAGPEEPLDRPHRLDSLDLQGYSGRLTGGIGG